MLFTSLSLNLEWSIKDNVHLNPSAAEFKYLSTLKEQQRLLHNSYRINAKHSSLIKTDGQQGAVKRSQITTQTFKKEAKAFLIRSNIIKIYNQDMKIRSSASSNETTKTHFTILALL